MARVASLGGLPLAHPLGLAAGYDRDGTRIEPIVAAGFAFAEFGTVTLRPEAGHNGGAAALAAALGASRARGELAGMRVGVNLGANFDTPEVRVAGDWIEALGRVAPVADYVAVNLSAPYYRHLLAPRWATPLRRALRDLAAAAPPGLPLLAKLPLGAAGLDVVELAGDAGTLGLSGVVASLADGADASAADLLAALRDRLGGLTLVAVGGIRSAADACARLAAGADALQIYSAFADGGAPVLQVLYAALTGATPRAGPTAAPKPGPRSSLHSWRRNAWNDATS